MTERTSSISIQTEESEYQITVFSTELGGEKFKIRIKKVDEELDSVILEARGRQMVFCSALEVSIFIELLVMALERL